MNIGDYAKKAGRLSMLEHGAYTLLIHSCYDREQFPTLDDAYDWCWARSEEEKQAVEFVLGKFFDLSEGIYTQNRIQQELSKYHENSVINKRIAIEREAKRTKRTRTVNEPPPNQEPINQEPRTNKPVLKEKDKKKRVSVYDLILQEEVCDKIINDFIAHRKNKKALITETAINGIRREAKKANISLETALKECCERGWVGFKADWYNKPADKQTQASIAARSIFGGNDSGCDAARIIEHEAVTKLLD